MAMAEYRAAADVAGVFHHLGIRPTQELSCYRWSPVFPAEWQGQPVVLKLAAKRNGDAIAGWCRHLRSVGIPVVAPVELPVPNPCLLGDQRWVVYPWVSGRTYAAEPADIAAAGDLLGRIHSAEPPDKPLGEHSWLEYQPGEAAADLEKLRDCIAKHAPEHAERLDARLAPLCRDFERVSAPAIRNPDLPTVASSMDYKANNLVFTSEGPVLVDPDGAARAPRIADLALAALLFHTELDSAPGRRFTQREWQLFRDAYLAHVELTELERRTWADAVDFMHWDEGTWAITDSIEWDNERQRSFLIDLAGTPRDAYPL